MVVESAQCERDHGAEMVHGQAPVAIGPLALGTLAKGEWRMLTAEEVQALREASASAS